MPFDPRNFVFEPRPDPPHPHNPRWTPRVERIVLRLVGLLLFLMLVLPISGETLVDTVHYLASL